MPYRNHREFPALVTLLWVSGLVLLVATLATTAPLAFGASTALVLASELLGDA